MKEQTVSIKRIQKSWNQADISIEINEEINIEELWIILAEALAQHLKEFREMVDKTKASEKKEYNDYVKMLLGEITKTVIS